MQTGMFSKPGLAAFRTEYLPGIGYRVVDPDGNQVGDFTGFRLEAERKREQLQIAADAKAKRGPRSCLSCGTRFASEGVHNRLCKHCRNQRDMGSMSISAIAGGKGRHASRA